MPVRRVLLADVRDNDQYLRATWHPETEVVVVSHWVGEVCVASTPLGVADLSKLIGLLVSALQESATRPLEQPAVPAVSSTGWAATVLDRWRRRMAPKLADVIALHRPSASRDETADHGR